METGEIIRAACLGWSCPECSRKRRAELSLRTRMAMNALWKRYGGHAQFLTLTLDPKRNGASAANGTKRQARYVSRSWRRLVAKWRERCRRRGLVPPWYLKVAEWREKSDAMHLHVIFLGWLPSSTEMKADIVSAGFGSIFDIGKVKSVARLTRYVTTYVTKTSSLGAPRYVHRYSASRAAIPPLVLWKRLVGMRFLPELKRAADGRPWFFAAKPEAWWTGEKRQEIEVCLEGMEAVRELVRPRRKLRWIPSEPAPPRGEAPPAAPGTR